MEKDPRIGDLSSIYIHKLAISMRNMIHHDGESMFLFMKLEECEPAVPLASGTTDISILHSSCKTWLLNRWFLQSAQECCIQRLSSFPQTIFSPLFSSRMF